MFTIYACDIEVMQSADVADCIDYITRTGLYVWSVWNDKGERVAYYGDNIYAVIVRGVKIAGFDYSEDLDRFIDCMEQGTFEIWRCYPDCSERRMSIVLPDCADVADRSIKLNDIADSLRRAETSEHTDSATCNE